MAGMIVTWLQKTKKLRDALLPRSEERDRGRRRRRLEADREEDHVALGVLAGDPKRVQRRVHDPHVRAPRLRVEERAASAGDAEHVPERRERDLGSLRDRDRVIDPPHRDHAHRAPRPVDQADLRRKQVLDSVPVDRVRVPAADLHQLDRASRLGERGDLGRELARDLGRAKLVDEPHGASPTTSSTRW